MRWALLTHTQSCAAPAPTVIATTDVALTLWLWWSPIHPSHRTAQNPSRGGYCRIGEFLWPWPGYAIQEDNPAPSTEHIWTLPAWNDQVLRYYTFYPNGTGAPGHSTTATFSLSCAIEPPFGFYDNFDDNVLDTTRWQKLEVNTGTVAETNHRLEGSCPAHLDLAGVCTRNPYDLTGATARLWVHATAARFCKLTISLTQALAHDPANDNDWYRVYLQRVPNTYYVDRKVAGAYVNLFNKPWDLAQMHLRITIDLPWIHFYERGILRYSEHYALGSLDCYLYADAQAWAPFFGTNFFEDFHLFR